MILTSIIVGAVVSAAVVGLVAKFWNSILDFLQRAVDRVKDIVNGVLYGSKVLLKKVWDGIKEISRHYSKVDNHWEETIITQTVSESEVPEEFLRRARMDEELDISDELEMQLETA